MSDALPNMALKLTIGEKSILVMARSFTLFLAFILFAEFPAVGERRSICRGTPERGSLENGCKLPEGGNNFTAYSTLGSSLGRTYVYCTVASVVNAAYEDIGRRLPDVRFVYGETGWARGGRFRPHKTHQNGLSVDFFVPVRDRSGRSVPLPTGVSNKWGYSIEFNQNGRAGNYVIDFDAMAAHLLALDRAARASGIGIRRVIFDPEIQPQLRKSKLWSELNGKMKFSTGRSWVRHDEHYHVDFDIPCEPL